jgi:hypothetical protein
VPMWQWARQRPQATNPRRSPEGKPGQPGRVVVGEVSAACHTSRVSVSILDREMYTEAAAARLLRVAPSTLHWWLEGRPPRYRPVIRVEPTNSRHVTWAEFVEAGLLRSYRREHDVPLKELREFIDRLRDEFQVPYRWLTGAPLSAQAGGCLSTCRIAVTSIRSSAWSR